MSEPLPEPTQFYIDACDSISQRALRQGVTSLSSIERIVLRAYIFDTDQQMGGLTSFFYNTDSSPEVAVETAAALEAIGAPATAAVFRTAASIICHSVLQQGASTWGERLQRVDPDGQLEKLCWQINELDECVFDLLESFVLRHRSELNHHA
jgi:hypothetical protein